MNNKESIIITAASRAYGTSLLALLGSINLNWPAHPPILVYDIGLDGKTLDILKQNKIKTEKVPAFCEHWRKHFTWKIWCINDAPAKNVLWMDAGMVVLRPMDEVYEKVEKAGYVLTSTGIPLSKNASQESYYGCKVKPELLKNRTTLNGCFMAFQKEGKILQILKEALELAKIEKYIAATEPSHRHDQALISLLMYREFDKPQIVENNIYTVWESPEFKPNQKTWHHRRGLNKKDSEHFIAQITKPGKSYHPRKQKSLRSKIPLYLIRRWLGKKHSGFIYDGIRD